MIITENSLRQPLRYEVDLSTGLVQTPLRTQLMKGDKQANTIIVKLTNSGESVDLTGVQVSGSFIRPGDSAEILLTGEAEGNEARVVLRDECYEQDGFFEANVKLLLGEVERTVLSITGNVLRKGSGEYVEITGVIPSVEDIFSQYETMKRVTQETQEAAGKANEAASRAPYIDEETGTWHVWSTEAGAYVDTGSIAAGPQGIPGATPYVGENGNWWIGETDTGTPATGPEGKQGPKGDQGDGLKILGLYGTLAALQSAHPTGSAGDAYSVGTPEDNEVYIWDVDAGAWKNLGALQGPTGPKGDDGVTPHIGANGNWWIGETDTGTPATGPEGPQGDDYNLTDADKQEIAGMAAGMVTVPKIELDTTLEEAGKAADAKATGDALNQISQQKANKAGWTANKLIGTDANGNLVAQDPPETNGGDADTLDGKAPAYYTAYTNLSDNSDFTHWVAQVGIGGTHGTEAYGGDRWILTSGTIESTANGGDPNPDGDGYSGIALNGTLVQVVPSPPAVATAFVEMVSGTAEISYDASKGEIILTSAGGVIKNVLLLEGEWTEKPEYVGKGYAAELAECTRYHLLLKSGLRWRAIQVNNAVLDFTINLPCEFRKIPDVFGTFKVNSLSGAASSGYSYSIPVAGNGSLLFRATKSGHGLTDGFLMADNAQFVADLPRRSAS